MEEANLRILFISAERPTRITGVGVRLFNLLQGIHQYHEVSLIYFASDHKEDEHLSMLAPRIRQAIRVDVRRAPAYIEKPLLIISNLCRRYPWFIRQYHKYNLKTKLDGICRSEFDLLYVDGAPLATCAIRYPLPRIIDPHDALSESFAQRAALEQNPFSRAFWLWQSSKTRTFESEIYPHFNKCVVTSSLDAKILKELNRNIDVYIIPNAVDTEYYRPVQRNGHFPLILFVGDMNSVHNRAAAKYFARDVFPHIRNQIHGARFLVLGRAPSKDIFELGSIDGVSVKGEVPDIRPFLASAAVVVAPMVSGMGVKNKILEALAMAKPVVTTSVGIRGLGSECRQSLIVSDHPIQFAKIVARLLSDESLREEMGLKARNYILEHYSIKKITIVANELFASVVESKS